MRSTKYKIEVDIYTSKIFLVLSDNPKKTFNTYAKKKQDWVLEEDDDVGYFIRDNSGVYYMFIKPDPTLEEFTHEIQHATFDILRDHGVVLSGESEEAFTYLNDYLVKKLKQKVQIKL